MISINGNSSKNTNPLTLNPYQYCEGNPLTKIDPEGRQSISTYNYILKWYYRVTYWIYTFGLLLALHAPKALSSLLILRENLRRTLYIMVMAGGAQSHPLPGKHPNKSGAPGIFGKTIDWKNNYAVKEYNARLDDIACSLYLYHQDRLRMMLGRSSNEDFHGITQEEYRDALKIWREQEKAFFDAILEAASEGQAWMEFFDKMMGKGWKPTR